MIDPNRHQATIVDQFTQQAIPFTQLPGHYDALGLLVEFSNVSPSDEVLDVACGPGIVACALALHAHQVTGIDLTPAMLEQAAARQQEQALTNTTWQQGDALALPFPDAHFSLSITRYSFHHLLDPAAALREMCRVTRPGGIVVVADMALPDSHTETFDAFEKVRDPSHVHALGEREFERMFASSGLLDCSCTSYSVDLGLDEQLQASFPEEGAREWLAARMTENIENGNLGVRTYRQDGQVRYQIPIQIYRGRCA